MRSLPSWKEYWFRPWPLINLAVCRLIIVGYQLYLIAVSWDHNARFAEEARRPAEMFDALPVLHVLLLPMGWEYRPSLEFIHAVYWLTVVAGWLSLFGLLTNPSLMLFTAGNLLMGAYHYSFRDFHHPEGVMMIALMALSLSPAGRALAVDDLWRRVRRNHREMRFEPYARLDEKSEFARWPLVVVRWIFALVYFSAFKSKFQRGGFEWMNGDALQYYMYEDGLRWSGWSLWLADFHWLNVVLSWATMLFEGLFFIVLIFPRAAWIFVPTGAGMHLGIYFTMRARFFQYLACYSVFIAWTEAFRRMHTRLERRCGGRHPEVLYDGQCPLCIRSVTVLHYLDWLGRMEFSDLEQRASDAQPPIPADELRREMHMVLPGGEVRRGFYAFRHACRYMPLAWVAVPLLYVPGVPFVGRRVYAMVAGGRRRLCGDEACALHGTKR